MNNSKMGEDIPDDKKAEIAKPLSIDKDNIKENAELLFIKDRRQHLLMFALLAFIVSIMLYITLIIRIFLSSDIAKEWHIIAILAFSASSVMYLAIKAVSEKDESSSDIISDKVIEQYKQITDLVKSIYPFNK